MSHPYTYAGAGFDLGYPALPVGYRRPMSVAGTAPTSPLRVPDASQDYVTAVRPRGDESGVPRVLQAWVDDLLRDQGPYIYHAMHLDSACKSASDMLALAVLAGGMDLAPAGDPPKPGTKDEDRTPDQVKAAELVDECWRHVEALEDFEAALRNVLDATWEGVKLARPVLALAEDGPDAGKMTLAGLTVKPNDAWRFVCDDFLNVVQIEAQYGSPAGSGNGQAPAPKERYPAADFLWLTWEMQGNNPYGCSEYRAANEPWNLKYLGVPEYRNWLHQFASGMIHGTTAPGEVNRAEVDPATGQPTGMTITPQQYMANELGQLGNGRTAAFPAGSTVSVVFPSGAGEPFFAGFDWSDRQIHLAILGTTSATLEAQHDSRAKGETGQDVLGMKVERGRKSLGAFVRRLLRMLVTLNHGPEAARLTPLVTFGQSDPQDRGELWKAAFAGGLKIGPSQVAEVCQIVGLPQPDMEADEAKADEAAEKAMERQRQMAPDGPPPPGGKPAPPGPRPKPKARPGEEERP